MKADERIGLHKEWQSKTFHICQSLMILHKRRGLASSITHKISEWIGSSRPQPCRAALITRIYRSGSGPRYCTCRATAMPSRRSLPNE